MSDLFGSAGALQAAYQKVDWAASALGPVESWSPTLRAAVDLMVRVQVGATLLWGPEFVLLYNEAYVPILAEKHPAALGRPAREVFPEVWQEIEPLLTSVFAGEGTVGIDDLRLLLHRHGMLQESFFTFSYSAVAAEDGTVEGVLDVVVETTARVVGNRRLALLSRLIGELADADLDSPQDLLDRALPVLRQATAEFASVDVHIDTALPVAADDEGRVSVHLAGESPSRAGTLVVRANEHLPVDAAYREFVALIAAALERGLGRIHARRTERRSASRERAMSEALQRSLLTEPIQLDGLQVAVRYRPAAEQAQVGGDWYDAFLVPEGCLTLVVGDVTGHDRHSAAAMAQVRNLTRGIAYTLGNPPARILSGLDAAMSGLAVDTYATAILAQIEQGDAATHRGAWTLRWSSAGHPPPILLHTDGTVEVLGTPPEALLGMRVKKARSDHTTTLEPGAGVVLYTDGLIERRHIGFDEGIADLVALLAGRRHQSAEQICDLLLEHFGYTTEDDIVLTVVHVAALT